MTHKLQHDSAVSEVEADMPRNCAHPATKASGTTGLLRLAGSTMPAAGVTFGLFLVMGSLIATEFIPAEATEYREVGIIVPQEKDELEVRPRDPIKRVETFTAPPRAEPFTISKHEVKVPTPVLTGEAPSDYGLGQIPAFEVLPVAITDTDAKPIRSPIVSYPPRALSEGIEGECTVQFDVSVRGEPYNINATCSHTVFKRSAEKAVRGVKFAPKIVSGKAHERRNVVYPIQFTLT